MCLFRCKILAGLQHRSHLFCDDLQDALMIRTESVFVARIQSEHADQLVSRQKRCAETTARPGRHRARRFSTIKNRIRVSNTTAVRSHPSREPLPAWDTQAGHDARLIS